MNPNLTEIAFVLDRSGSMGAVAGAAIDGFNTFLRGQQEASGLARLTLVLFDHEYLVPVAGVPVEEVLTLNSETYVPRGATALLDAMGKTIDDIGRRLEHTPEADRPGKVIVGILTDGLENASRRYSWSDVSARILHQTTVYNWEFLFLGANQDAIATAANLNITANNAAAFSADAAGVKASTAALIRKTTTMRAAATKATLSKLEEEDLAAPLSSLVDEEYTKENN